MFLYHIARRADWERAKQMGMYTTSTLGKTLEQAGYIHLSFARQVKLVADALYSGMDDLVLLRMHPARLAAPVKVEEAQGMRERLPHLYGPLNLNAVERVLPYSHTGGSFPAVRETGE